MHSHRWIIINLICHKNEKDVCSSPLKQTNQCLASGLQQKLIKHTPAHHMWSQLIGTVVFVKLYSVTSWVLVISLSTCPLSTTDPWQRCFPAHFSVFAPLPQTVIFLTSSVSHSLSCAHAEISLIQSKWFLLDIYFIPYFCPRLHESLHYFSSGRPKGGNTWFTVPESRSSLSLQVD